MSFERKQLRKRLRPLRVRQSREILAKATAFATDSFRNGEPRETVVRGVRELVESEELAEALVSFVQNEMAVRPIRGAREYVAGYFLFVFCLASIGIVWRLFLLLSMWVVVAPNEMAVGFAAAFCQTVLVRFCWHVVKAGGIALTDALNLATYPTTLHRSSATSSELDAIRRERLRLLIAETVNRLGRREKLSSLYRELTEVELTKPAAFWLLIQAWIGMAIQANLPPYESRVQAQILAATTVAASIGALCIVRHKLHGEAQLVYLGVWACAIGLEFLKRPRGVEEFRGT